MKKIFAILLMSVMVLSAMAQSPVYRVGDKYMMDGKMMNKKEFKGYLQNTSPEAFQLFNNGYKLSIAGWTCLSMGVVTNSIGGGLLRRYIMDNNVQKDTMYDVGYALTSAGAGIAAAGVTCLAVGYTRMHKAANLYNLEKAQRPDLRWIFGMNNRGEVAIAMEF